MTPDAEADRLWPQLLARVEALGEHFGMPAEIPLSIYETDLDLATLRPEDGGKWSADFHRRVMQILATRLRLRGYRVRLVQLEATAYLRWLAAEKKTNTAANRAAFVSLARRPPAE